MDRIVEELADRLARGSSRRGFLATVGKIAMAGVALAAGAGLSSAAAGSCCPNLCNNNGVCPPGTTYEPWQSYCCGVQPNRYLCGACVNTQGYLDCYITTQESGTQCAVLPQ